MRIAFTTAEYVTESNFDGGLANYIHRIALSLLKMGHEPIVLVASSRDESFLHQGIQIHRVKIKSGDGKRIIVENLMRIAERFLNLKRSVELFRMAKSLNNKIDQIHQEKKIDIIQYSHLGGFSLLKNINVPSVIRLSSYTPLCRKQGGYDCDTPFQIKQQEFIEKLALKKADAVFGPSRLIASLVEKDLDIKVEIIESPFIFDIKEPDDTVYLQKLKGKKYLLYFGTLNFMKGVVTIADMLHELLGRHPDIHFVLVGKEQKGGYKGQTLMEYIKSRAKEYSDRVVYLGQMHHEQLYPVIENSMAVVLPSRIDNFPNTCIEAMAHRKVVIGTYGTSFEQLLRDGESGFLCTIGDSKSLLDTIEKMLGLSNDKRTSIGNEAYKRIEDLHPEKITRKLVGFYEKSIKCHS